MAFFNDQSEWDNAYATALEDVMTQTLDRINRKETEITNMLTKVQNIRDDCVRKENEIHELNKTEDIAPTHMLMRKDLINSSTTEEEVRKPRCDECKENYIRKMVKSEDLEIYVKDSKNWQEIMEKCDINYINNDMFKRIKNYDTSHLPILEYGLAGKMQKYSKKYLIQLTKDNSTWTDMLRTMKLLPTKSVKTIIQRHLQNIEIDYCHLKNNINTLEEKEDIIKKIFVKNSKTNRGAIKNYLIEVIEMKYECAHCHISHYSNDIYKDRQIVLELDHINGDNTDNSLDNLRFLCPICHSFTDNYCGKNTLKTKEAITDANIEKHCMDCETIIHKDSQRCNTCAKKPKDTKKPSYEDMIEKYKELKSILKLSHHYDSSKETIKTWFRSYNNDYTNELKKIKEDNYLHEQYHKQNTCKTCDKQIYNTSTYCNDCYKKTKNVLPKDKKCSDCDKLISSVAMKCYECHQKTKSYKVQRPSYEQLLEDYKKEKTFRALGRKYGVSDNSVRKWINTDEKYKNFYTDIKK